MSCLLFKPKEWAGYRIREVEIASCVHFCGYRYGRDDFNPYENYVKGLTLGCHKELLREKFVDYLLHFRPKSLGELLGVQTSAPIPLWLLPWAWRKPRRLEGWQSSASEINDIMTQFCREGVPIHILEDEFIWLERALEAISEKGYKPDQYGYIEVFQLRGKKDSMFLVLDGNHRICALHALGQKKVKVMQRRLAIAHRSRACFWPLVITKQVAHADALRIFDAYFDGNLTPYREETPASLVECN